MEIKCQLDATDDFYCRSYCLLNMFRAPLCPSSGAREYCTEGCCLWYLVLWFSSCRYGVELRVMFPVCGLLQQIRSAIRIIYCIQLAFYLHILTTMHHQNHFKKTLYFKINELRGAQFTDCQKFPRILQNPEVHCLFIKAHLLSLSRATPPLPQLYLFHLHFKSLLSLRLDLHNGLFPSGFQAKTLYAFHCTLYTPYFPPLSSSVMLWPILLYEEYK